MLTENEPFDVTRKPALYGRSALVVALVIEKRDAVCQVHSSWIFIVVTEILPLQLYNRNRNQLDLQAHPIHYRDVGPADP